MNNQRHWVLYLSLAGIVLALLALRAGWFDMTVRPRPITPSPTSTPRFTETSTSTPTPTPTPTDTPTATATVQTFKAKVSQPSYCYNGPSENYLDATIVAADAEVDILGMNSDSRDWFMIQGATVARCWIRSTFLSYNSDKGKILVLTTAFTTVDSACRTYPKEGRKEQTHIPPGWRIVVNAKSNPADWVLVTPHDSTEQCWVAKKSLTTFADGLLPSVDANVLASPTAPAPTSTRHPNTGKKTPTAVAPTSAQPTSIGPTSVQPTPIPPTPVPPTPIPPTSVPPTRVPPTLVPPTPTLCWPPGHCK